MRKGKIPAKNLMNVPVMSASAQIGTQMVLIGSWIVVANFWSKEKQLNMQEWVECMLTYKIGTAASTLVDIFLHTREVGLYLQSLF